MAKIIVLLVFSIIAGIGFIGTGLYFLSAGFLRKLNESSPEKNAESEKRNAFRAKGSGYVSLALGAITLVWGIFVFMFPPIASVLALIYMILLIGAFGAIMLVFK